MQIALDRIVSSETLIREVDKTSEGYLNLRNSLHIHGQLQPIVVSDLGADTYRVVLGNNRLSCARDLGWNTIECSIGSNRDETTEIVLQMAENHDRIPGKNTEYAHGLKMILSKNPLMTIADLAERTGKSEDWCKGMLKIANLADEVRAYIVQKEKEQGKAINAQNLVEITKLNGKDQITGVDRAFTLPPADFKNFVRATNSERNKEKVKTVKEWVPVAVFRKKSDTETALANPAAFVSNMTARGENFSSVTAAVQSTLEWVLSVDKESIEIQKKELEDRKAKVQAEKDKAKKEREAILAGVPSNQA